MKRYTFFTDDYPVVTCDHCYEDQNENYCGPAIEKLAEYEATGLEPAEVAALQWQLRYYKRELTAQDKELVEAIRCKNCFANGCCSIQIDLGMGGEGYCPKGRRQTG